MKSPSACWSEVRLADVVKPRRRKLSGAAAGHLPFIGLEHVEAHTSRLLGKGCAADMKSAVAAFEDGDVLYGRLRPYLNKVIRPRFAGTASAEFIVMPENERLDGEFLRRVLMQPSFVEFASQINQGDRPRVDFEQIGEFTFLLPPIAEQHRIVEDLENTLRCVATARDHLARVPDLVARYKQAVLAAAFMGDLTAEWRRTNPSSATSGKLLADLEAARVRVLGTTAKQKPVRVDSLAVSRLAPLPTSWTWASVDLLASKVSDGVHKKPEYLDTGIPFLTVRNLTAGPGISFEGCRCVSPADHREFIKRTHPENGDLLISKDGTLGVVRAVRTRAEFSIFVSLALVKPIDRTMTDYLELALSAPQVQEQMIGVGSGLQHIHLTDLRRDHIPVAPPMERAEIESQVRSRFERIDRLQAEANRAQMLLDRLERQLVARVFAGGDTALSRLETEQRSVVHF